MHLKLLQYVCTKILPNMQSKYALKIIKYAYLVQKTLKYAQFLL